MSTQEIIDALRQWQRMAEKSRSGAVAVDYVLLRNAADEIERLTAQIEVLKLDRNMHRSMSEVYLAERQEMRNLFPACLDEFGPSLLDAMKQELEARK